MAQVREFVSEPLTPPPQHFTSYTKDHNVSSEIKVIEFHVTTTSRSV